MRIEDKDLHARDVLQHSGDIITYGRYQHHFLSTDISRSDLQLRSNTPLFSSSSSANSDGLNKKKQNRQSTKPDSTPTNEKIDNPKHSFFS